MRDYQRNIWNRICLKLLTNSVALGEDLHVSALFLLLAVRVQQTELFVGQFQFSDDSLATDIGVKQNLKQRHHDTINIYPLQT